MDAELGKVPTPLLESESEDDSGIGCGEYGVEKKEVPTPLFESESEDDSGIGCGEYGVEKKEVPMEFESGSDSFEQENEEDYEVEESGDESDEEQDDQDSNYFTLFVGHVPEDVPEHEIRAVFEKHGDVIEVRRPRLKTKKKQREDGDNGDWCFVKFGSKQEADKALEALNGVYKFSGSYSPVVIVLRWRANNVTLNECFENLERFSFTQHEDEKQEELRSTMMSMGDKGARYLFSLMEKIKSDRGVCLPENSTLNAIESGELKLDEVAKCIMKPLDEKLVPKPKKRKTEKGKKGKPLELMTPLDLACEQAEKEASRGTRSPATLIPSTLDQHSASVSSAIDISSSPVAVTPVIPVASLVAESSSLIPVAVTSAVSANMHSSPIFRVKLDDSSLHGAPKALDGVSAQDTEEITASSTWEECQQLFEESSAYRAIGEENIAHETFEESIAHLVEKAKEKERKREEKKRLERRKKRRGRRKNEGR